MTLDSISRTQSARHRRAMLLKGLAGSLVVAICGALAFAQDARIGASRDRTTHAIAPTPELNAMNRGIVGNGLVRGGPNDYEPNAVLVKFQPNASPAAMQNAVARLDLQVDTRVNSPYFSRLIIPDDMLADGYGVQDAIDMLKANPSIKTAEPDYHIYAMQATPPQFIPNDPFFKQQWALLNDGQEIVAGKPGGTPGVDIGASFAWPITQGSTDVIVAVIDTGVNYAHSDFYNLDFSETNILANNNGSVIGYDYVNFVADPFDDNGHGTECAGIIGAVSNNTFGISGVCPTVKLLPVKFLNKNGFGNVTAAVLAIDFARNNGADIINFSAGVGADSTILREAIQRTGVDNILFVAPAGNGVPDPITASNLPDLVTFGKDVDFNPVFPAAYNKVSANVISVAATDYDDNIAPFSYYGKSVDIAAPGVNILTTRGFGFVIDSGTSQASAHVAGVAALIKSKFKTISALQIKDKILKSAVHVPFLTGKVAVARRLSAYNTLLKDSIVPATPTELVAIKHSNSTMLMRFKASADSGAGSLGRATYYDARVSTSPITDANFNQATWVGAYVPTARAGIPVEFAVTGLFPGINYFVALKAYDAVGNPSGIITTGPVTPRSPTFFQDRVEGARMFTPQVGATWAPTTTESYSPTHSWTDSPGRKYNNNINQSLTLTNPILFSTNMLLQFQAKTDLEEGRDFLFIEVAKANLDGTFTNWAPMGQISGKNEWTFFNMAFPSPKDNKDSLIGKMLKFRFRIKTDAQNTADGVYIDDIRVVQSVAPFMDFVNPLAPKFISDGGVPFSIGDETVAPNHPAFSPKFYWSDSDSGNYNNDLDGRLTVAAPIFASGLAVPTIDFYLQTDLDTTTADFLYLEVSYDLGNTWRRWGAYTGTSGGYLHTTEFSPAYAGYDLMFRYHMVTDDKTVKDGIWLDNMRLQGEPLSSAVPVASATVSPVSVKGGSATPVTLTVNIVSAAPAGGLYIPISSDMPDVASVPATVFIPAGATSGDAVVTTKRVALDTEVTFTADQYVETKTVKLNVIGPKLTSITFTPTSKIGGTNVTGKLFIDSPAPVGGVVVPLVSEDPTLVKVPATVTVAAGQSSIAFTAKTTPVAKDIAVKISASYNASKSSGSLTVLAPTPKSVSFSPGSLKGGLNSIGKLILTGMAPAGGITVTLVSANAAVVQVPASVMVAGGTNVVTFPVTTTAVAVDTPVLVTATYNGASASRTITVKK